MKVPLAAALLLGAGAGHAADLPRLAGTLIAPGERTALFATEPGGTVPVVVGERVGEYVVSEIRPGCVQLDRPGRSIVVSVERAPSVRPPRDLGNATFGLVLRQQGPADQ